MKKKHHITFRTAAQEWLTDVKLRVKRSSYEKYVYILSKHIHIISLAGLSFKAAHKNERQ